MRGLTELVSPDKTKQDVSDMCCLHCVCVVMCCLVHANLHTRCASFTPRMFHFSFFQTEVYDI